MEEKSADEEIRNIVNALHTSCGGRNMKPCIVALLVVAMEYCRKMSPKNWLDFFVNSVPAAKDFILRQKT